MLLVGQYLQCFAVALSITLLLQTLRAGQLQLHRWFGLCLGFETRGGWVCVSEDVVVRPIDLSLIHISEPTRLLSISYAVFCLKKKKKKKKYKKRSVNMIINNNKKEQ
eukprot:TRINITY_DN12404_c0_g1_i3.p1 TRINITY_DN12404_c0_g1~~TRINITY_DN12404_c0_g1_i3.p1  ORF type:complete len:108 (+),score=31.43 TRINITY_DN12404_c0_g1_i3:623-946(+)